MASFSKLEPGLEKMSCSALIHPDSDGCLQAAVDLFFTSSIGAAGFFSLLNFCQYVSVIVKKKKKGNIKDSLRATLRSTFFASSVACGTISASCFFRNLLGRFYYRTMVFLPALIGGIAIFFDSRKGREIASNTFANCLLELWTTKLQNAKILRWTPNHQTIAFMILSSALSSLLSGTNYHQHYFWFFIPPKVADVENKNVCFHKGDCWKHVSEIFVKYSTTGLVLYVVRRFASDLKKPKSFIFSLATPKIFKLAAFLGTYVLIYESVRCFFYRKEKRSCLAHDALAGFLAGAAFRFRPTLPIFNSGLIAIFQILTEFGCRRKFLPNIPYLEIVFVLCCGLLFHERIFKGDNCSEMVTYILSAVTHSRIDQIAQNIKNNANNLSL